MNKFIYIASLIFLLNSTISQAEPNQLTKVEDKVSNKNIKSMLKQIPVKAVTFNVMPATSEARRWLSILDNKQFGNAWEKASILVRNTVTKEKFIEEATRSREPMGSFIKREIIMAQPKTKLPGSPIGQYVLITFKSKFHNKNKVNETIMMQKDPDNSWRVAGYFAY